MQSNSLKGPGKFEYREVWKRRVKFFPVHINPGKFQNDTLHRWAFLKAPFSVTENAVSVWTVGLTGEKRCVFKFTRVSVDGALDHFRSMNWGMCKLYKSRAKEFRRTEFGRNDFFHMQTYSRGDLNWNYFHFCVVWLSQTTNLDWINLIHY